MQDVVVVEHQEVEAGSVRLEVVEASAIVVDEVVHEVVRAASLGLVASAEVVAVVHHVEEGEATRCDDAIHERRLGMELDGVMAQSQQTVEVLPRWLGTLSNHVRLQKLIRAQERLSIAACHFLSISLVQF